MFLCALGYHRTIQSVQTFIMGAMVLKWLLCKDQEKLVCILFGILFPSDFPLRFTQLMQRGDGYLYVAQRFSHGGCAAVDDLNRFFGVS